MLRRAPSSSTPWLAMFVPLLLLTATTVTCRRQSHAAAAADIPSIALTNIPKARAGGPERTARIAGVVRAAKPGQRVVLYAKSGVWWVQPTRDEMFTKIASDETWQNNTHYGWQYAALLVDSDYQPSTTLLTLPAVGGHILAKTASEDVPETESSPTTIEFSGYRWIVRQNMSDRGRAVNDFSAKNVFVDKEGRLHLRITRGADRWQCAEIRNTRSLGYGTYSFVMREVTATEPPVVVAMYTFDEVALESNQREMDIEISRWGGNAGRSAQFAVQPYYIPANVLRAPVPAGPLRYAMRWLPGRVDFSVSPTASQGRLFASQSFTSSVPSPGKELLYIGLYAYDNANRPLTHETEVIVDAFEYLP